MLGLVQGFTTALTDVTGMLEAHVHVTGTAADPRTRRRRDDPERARSRVEPNGVSYTNLDGRIDLQPDRIHIDQLTVLDNHQSPLTITGDLAIPRAPGRRHVDLPSRPTDFKVIDNEMGNVRVDSRPAGRPASCGRPGSKAISA